MKAPPSYNQIMQHSPPISTNVPTSSDNLSPPSYTQAMTIQEDTPDIQQPNNRQPQQNGGGSTP